MSDKFLIKRFPALNNSGWNLFSEKINTGRHSCTLFSILNPVEGKKNMLFIHGLGSSWNSWANSVEEFASCYNIYLLDMPWNCANPCPFTKLHDLVEWVCSVIRAIKIPKPIVITHSFGGIVFLNMLGMIEPCMIDRLIICSLNWMCGRSEQAQKELYEKFYSNFYELVYYSLMSGIRPGTDPDLIHHMCKRVKDKLNMDAIRDYLTIGHQEALPFPDDVDIPTVFITGDDDVIADKQDSILISRKIKGSKIFSIPKSNHFPMVQVKEAFYGIIHNFCREEVLS